MICQVYIRAVIIQLIVLYTCSASAQLADIQYYTTADGLSNSRVWDVAQDKNGILWLSTDVTNRFDGRQFLNHSNRADAIFQRHTKGSTVHAVGDEVVSVQYDKLISVNVSTGEMTELSLSEFLGDNAKIVQGNIKPVSSDAIIIPITFSDSENLDLVRYRNGQLEKIAELHHAVINYGINQNTSARRSPDFFYYVDSQLGHLMEIDVDGKVTREVRIPYGNLAGAGAGINGSILLGQNGNVFYAEGDREVFLPHPINRHLSKLTNFTFNSVVQTDDGDLWMTGGDRKLLFYDLVHDTIYSLREQLVDIIPHRLELKDISKGEGGVLWLNTIKGLVKVNPYKKWFGNYYTGQRDDCAGQCSFRGMAEDDEGNIYASYYANLFKIDPKLNRLSKPLYRDDRSPFDLFFYRGNLLINRGGVFDLDNNEVVNAYSFVEDSYDDGKFAYDANHGLWWTFKSNLYYLNEQGETAQWQRASGFETSEQISDIKFDKSGFLWISNQNGLDQFIADFGNVELVRRHAFDKNYVIRFMYHSADSIIWMATDLGLLKYQASSGATRLFNEENGLPNRYVVTILQDGDSCLWMGTHGGLSRFHINNEVFTNFFKEDGLANEEFNRRSAYLASDGRMYFGGISGISAFYPETLMDRYRRENTTGQLSLVEFSKSNVKNDTVYSTIFFEKDPKVDIYFENRTFQFEYILADFDNKNTVLYSYQMEGYENTWSKPSIDNRATFNYLPAGNYTFRVKAMTSRGQWLKDELKVNVVVHPPWYLSTWGYLFFSLLICGVSFVVYLFLKRRWELQTKLKLEHQESVRLKELDQYKSRLYTNLTHEFRTPLTVILGMVEQSKLAFQVCDDPTTDAIHNSMTDQLLMNFDLIERNSVDLLRLINQLLDLSKLENNALQLQLQQSNIVPYIRYVTESFQSYANTQNISIRFFTSFKKLIMDFDPEQVKHLMTNLISNAVKFTPSGGEVKVELEEITDGENDSSFLHILVADNGIGISESQLPYIFDRFYQANNSSTRKQEGTGIGLSHTQELVHLMGGRVTVSSEVNKGSTFTIRLPVKHDSLIVDVELNDELLRPAISAPISKSDNAVNVHQTPSEADYEKSRLSLLIIEDNPDVVYYLKSCLKDHYQIDVAMNGDIGVRMALEHIPDLIISDLMMPEKDGYEVCDILKHDERTSHIPIILLTAKADVASKITGLRRGADAYVAKPFNKEELLVRLESLAELRKRLLDRFSGTPISTESLPPELEDTFHIENSFVRKVHKIVEENYADEDFTLAVLCQKVGMSRSQLFRKMKALMNRSPSEFIKHYRIEQAKILLESGNWTVSEVAWKVGFKHLSHFSKSYVEQFGFAPSATIK